ncbi:hypothetical protein CDIK_1239 [Cucumispora dikerogammari]|nr:hypothetical protein CDIK_1239 [Cucumispora dikerogammari]
MSVFFFTVSSLSCELAIPFIVGPPVIKTPAASNATINLLDKTDVPTFELYPGERLLSLEFGIQFDRTKSFEILSSHLQIFKYNKSCSNGEKDKWVKKREINNAELCQGFEMGVDYSGFSNKRSGLPHNLLVAYLRTSDQQVVATAIEVRKSIIKLLVVLHTDGETMLTNAFRFAINVVYKENCSEEKHMFSATTVLFSFQYTPPPKFTFSLNYSFPEKTINIFDIYE